MRPIAYDFRRSGSGQVTTVTKDLLRIDPGERITVEVIDFDRDTTGQPDEVMVDVQVSGGETLQLAARETEPSVSRRIRWSSFTKTDARSLHSAKLDMTPFRSQMRCVGLYVRTRTSFSSGKCVTLKRFARPSPPRKRVTWCSPRCTPWTP